MWDRAADSVVSHFLNNHAKTQDCLRSPLHTQLTDNQCNFNLDKRNKASKIRTCVKLCTVSSWRVINFYCLHSYFMYCHLFTHDFTPHFSLLRNVCLVVQTTYFDYYIHIIRYVLKLPHVFCAV